jgi:ferritin
MSKEDEQRLEEIREKAEKGSHADFLLTLIDEQAAENKHLKELFAGEDKENLKLLSEVNALRSEVERLKAALEKKDIQYGDVDIPEEDFKKAEEALKRAREQAEDDPTWIFEIIDAALEGKDE